METTIYKTGTIIDSEFNVKYHVHFPNVNSKYYFYYPESANSSIAIDISILAYNGTLSTYNVSQYATLTLVETIVVGNDTIYCYNFNTGATITCGAALTVGSTCTKILIEDKEEIIFGSDINTTKLSLDAFLLHASRKATPTPRARSISACPFGCINKNIYIKDDNVCNLANIEEVMPYYTCMMGSNLKIEGNISIIAENIKLDQPHDTYPEYSFIRIQLPNSMVSGDTGDFYGLLQDRRSTKWACQLVLTNTKVTNNIQGTTLSSVNCLCDKNGDFSYYTSIGDLSQALIDDATS